VSEEYPLGWSESEAAGREVQRKGRVSSGSSRGDLVFLSKPNANNYSMVVYLVSLKKRTLEKFSDPGEQGRARHFGAAPKCRAPENESLA
jgi:hypothetical protein